MSRSIGQIESRKHEVRLGNLFGGKRTPGSGAFWSQKGDVKTPELLIEHKFTGIRPIRSASLTIFSRVMEDRE